MSAAESPSSIDALWESLAPHVEWPERFSLVFLFAGHPGPVERLRTRLEWSLRERGMSLIVLDPASAEEVEGLTPALVRTPEEGCGAAWVSLLRRAGAPGWEEAMRELLYRLNERRSLLERDLAVPMVVVLPLELWGKVYGIAPDLWTVRSFVGEVPGVETARGKAVRPAPVARAAERWVGSAPGRAEVEWARLVATGDARRLAVVDGLAAFDSALDRGDLGAARRIGMETLAVALKLADVDVERWDDFDVAEALGKVGRLDPRSQRLLGASLNRLGHVEMLAGNLAAARHSFQRTLDISEALTNADTHSAPAKRDLSVALNRLGDVEMQAGNLAAARDSFQRSLDIFQALTNANTHSALAKRDLSVALNRLGDVEMQAGNLAAARDSFQRDLDISEALANADTHSALAKRDLSAALNRLGDVEMQAGNLAAARDSFQRSLDICEALANADTHSALAKRDLSVALQRLGQLETAAGDLVAARCFFQRSLDLGEALAAADSHDAQASFDVIEAHDHLARVAKLADDSDTELDHLRQAHTLLETMATNNQLAGFAEREALRDDIARRLEALTPPPAQP